MSSYFEPALTAAQAAALADIANGTTSVPVIRPSLAAPTLFTSGAGPFVAGDYVEVVAVNDLAAHQLIGAMFFNTAGGRYQIELGSGGAGAEVVIWRFPFLSVLNVGNVVYFPCVPACQIAANARLALRSYSNAGPEPLQAYLVFIPRPLA